VFEDAGIPCGPINTIDKVFADPQVQHLGMARPVEHPRLGTEHVVASALTMSGVSQGHPHRHPRRRRRHRRGVARRRLFAGADYRTSRQGRDLMSAYANGKMLAEVQEGIGLITFNQPEKRNAMSGGDVAGTGRNPGRVFRE